MNKNKRSGGGGVVEQLVASVTKPKHSDKVDSLENADRTD